MDEGLHIPCAQLSECSNQSDHGLEGPCVYGASSWKPELVHVCGCGKLTAGRIRLSKPATGETMGFGESPEPTSKCPSGWRRLGD